MQPTQLLKCLVVALPMFTVACSSTPEEVTQEVQTAPVEDNSAEVSALEKQRLMEIEAAERKLAALRQSNTIYFEFDDSKVQGQYMEILEAHATYLRANPSVKVTVEGHADERGTPEYNIALGERRAVAVAKYLQNLGVMSSQISTVSYGEEKPVDKSRSESGFSKNRRAVLVY